MNADLEPSETHSIRVFDLNMARAYYTCVFDAEADDEGDDNRCAIRIGAKRFDLIRDKVGAEETPQHCAQVADVDVSVARVATRGGKIVDRPHPVEGGGREGCVIDPFGHRWLVRTRP